MTKAIVAGLLIGLGMATPSVAGDAAAGEKGFNKCKACHAITAPDGTAVIKGGKTGPDLFGVIGRPVASFAGFNYGESIKAVGATGAVWDEAMLAAYAQNPTAWLQEKLGDPGAKSNMSFKLAKGAEDLASYLATQQ